MSRKNLAIAVSPEILPQDPVLFQGDLAVAAEKASKYGYHGLEIHVSTPDKLDKSQLQELCTTYDLSISALATGLAKRSEGLDFLDDQPEIREKAVERVKEFIDFAADFQASVILGSLRGNIPDKNNREESDKRFFAAMNPLVAYAEEKKVTLLLEVINRYENNYLNSAKEAVEYIAPIESDYLKLHLDTFHMNIEETDMADAVRTCGSRFGYLHLADNTRLGVGTGSIDFAKVIAATEEVGYTGYLSLECLPLPDGDRAAAQSAEEIAAIYNVLHRV